MKAFDFSNVDGERMAAAADHYFMVDDRCCGESVLKSGCEALGIESDVVPGIALGLGGGMGLQGHVCGAVSAAALVLSIAISKTIEDYPTRKMTAFGAVARLCTELEKRFGSIQCRKMCGLDLTTEEGINQLISSVKAQKCAGFLKESARALAIELKALAK
jgi:C_GCAxxG_C_C family probable redox protein